MTRSYPTKPYEGKTNAELFEIMDALESDPANKETTPGSIYKHNKKTRAKLDAIALQMTMNRPGFTGFFALGGYSGRKTNKRR